MSYTTSKRPRVAERGGRGMYCCIPQCGSAQNDKHKQKINIALFSFPNKEKKPEVYKVWYKEIQKYRRKGGDDGFKINKYTKVCEFHFKEEEIKISIGCGIKTLKTGNEVPSIYKFKQTTSEKKRKSPHKRLIPTTTNSESDIVFLPNIVDCDILPTDEEMSKTNEASRPVCERCEQLQLENKALKLQLEQLDKEKNKILEENRNLQIFNQSLNEKLFTFDNISKDEENFKSFTGIEVDKFRILFDYLDPGDHCENIKYYDKSMTKTVEFPPENIFSSPSYINAASKPGPKPAMKAIEQLLCF